ncbi:GNAT family N-acetyltransferase [Massilia antarctica]|uniref:GNAT family N-acetyltransferase n=1 Tax=Massilia antarctica TaxID=2765360 RepID=UPI0006BB7A36|nr:GNAT family N-acetyltransferase [Massilia sp. H27-R4]MCY0913991.1 GNAT family N-acetyltransferase [Massilia sp. H27-R4]CUI04269.1 acetyltransferase, GNAT family [Janthinobacterium sp. CG23_2]CUU28055.1 acetyltransferase, GNAT family [Janthinobacterium sp. CG23_2]
MTITLQAVTEDNFDTIVELPLLPEQQDYLASNAYSIAQASFYPDSFFTRAIYLDDKPIGFLMYVSLADEGEPGAYAIYRFMVDSGEQGKGYGRRAIGLVLDEIRSRPDATVIQICYWPTNQTAKDFYASLGFVETGLDEEGEMYAEIRLDGAAPAAL